MVEKDRDRDGKRDKYQPEVRASLEKVEKEVKKIRVTTHLKKFEARALDGHHRDYMLLLSVRLARQSTHCLFSFSF